MRRLHIVNSPTTAEISGVRTSTHGAIDPLLDDPYGYYEPCDSRKQIQHSNKQWLQSFARVGVEHWHTAWHRACR